MNVNEVRPTWVERGTEASSCTRTSCTRGAPLCPFIVEGVCLQANGVKLTVWVPVYWNGEARVLDEGLSHTY